MKERVYDKDTKLVFGQAINFINYFAENDGFQAIIEILKHGNIKPIQPQNKPSTEKEEVYELMTIDFLS